MIHAKAYRCGAKLKSEEAKERAARSNRGAFVQTAAADSASNEFFVEMLAAQTLKAEETGSMLARRPEMDFLLRLAGTTQISKAISQTGASAGRPYLLVVAGRTRLRGVSGLGRRELPRRDLTDSELGRVEKAALLNAERA